MALSLRRALIAPYAALVALLAVAIGVLSYRSGSEAVNTILDSRLREASERIGRAVDHRVGGSSAVLRMAFPEGALVPASIKDQFDTLRTRFWNATSLVPDSSNYVYYANRGGQFFGLERKSANEGELWVKYKPDEPRMIYSFRGMHGDFKTEQTEGRQYEVRERPWFREAETGKRDTWASVYIHFRSDELVATIARRVLGADGALEGVVAAGIPLHAINDFVRQLHISKHGVAFIVEANGDLVASSASPYLRNLSNGNNARLNAVDSGNRLIERTYAEISAALAAGNNPKLPQTRVFEGPEGEPVHAVFDRVGGDTGLEWISVVVAPRSDFTEALRENMLRTAIAALLALGLALLIGFAILKWVARDLDRLSEAARKFGDGEIDARVGVERNDEIGALASSFERMQRRLQTDRLTGLTNREALTRHVDSEIALRVRQDSPRPFGLLFVDLDRFKQINDHYGHEIGDRVLVTTAHRLVTMTQSLGLVARYAGDEFAIYLDDASDREALLGFCARVEYTLTEPLDLPGVETIVPAASVGLASFPFDGDDSSSLLAHAHRQMYKRKIVGRI